MHKFFLMLLTILLSACAAWPKVVAPVGSEKGFKTQIRWTSYGIPHVRASNQAGLGYGFAYATATDAVCVIAYDVMVVNGDLSRYLGPGDGRLQSDVFHRALLTKDRLARYSDSQSSKTREFSRGYVAGYNRYLRGHSGDLPRSCAGKPWVRPITRDDMARLVVGVGIRYGLGWFKQDIANAAPADASFAAQDGAQQRASGLRYDFQSGIGSNAIALGGEVTESGRGLLLGNPHYPWRGSSRFHIIHTTIPGELDVMGVSLLTTDRVSIGFNRDVAWSHTVSTALRFTLYELQLNPDNPLEYKYDDSYRPIVPLNVMVEVADENGAINKQQHSVYMSHYGPLVSSRVLPWNRDVAYAIRDVNLDNTRSHASYDALNTAKSIDDVEAAISLQGVAWTNTIAADRRGTAFYADISVTPDVDAQLLERCRVSVPNLPAHVVVLKGSEPGCEWKTDPRSAVPGSLPAAEMPRIRRQDYVTNSNDSYWLANPQEPLEGYSPSIGPERTQRSLRTRAGLNFVQEILQQKGKLEPGDLQDMIYSQRNYAAEILLDDVLSLCDHDAGSGATNSNIAPACSALAGWDRRQANSSRGAQVWTEFWRIARKIPELYRFPFDVNDPLHTPRGINIDKPKIALAVRAALVNTQSTLYEAGVALDQRWGDVQFAVRNGERIPVPGGQSWAGMFSVISADLNKGMGYTPIKHGNSFIQVISWDREGRLVAQGILTYSQSQEPESPHYDDQTKLYAAGKWIRFPFSEDEIQADPELQVLELSE